MTTDEHTDKFAPVSTDCEPEDCNRSTDDNILQFLDSVDDYLTLMGSLSSTLGQGWMDLASARHSMGVSRVSSALFDLKSHSAATNLQLDLNDDENQPQFGLQKWGFHETGAKQNDDQQLKKQNTLQLRRRGSVEPAVGQDLTKGEVPAIIDLQKERAKSLSVFGTLVSPKLRSSQLSFETALETIVQLANMRSSLLHAADNVRKDMECFRS